jgi:hypothetical protein
LDEVSNNGIWSFTQGTSNSPQNPSCLRGAYGPAEYDVRHSMNADYVWELPVKSVLRGRGPRAVLSGWQVSGTFFARTGFPYSVFDFALSGSQALASWKQSSELGSGTLNGSYLATGSWLSLLSSRVVATASLPAPMHKIGRLHSPKIARKNRENTRAASGTSGRGAGSQAAARGLGLRPIAAKLGIAVNTLRGALAGDAMEKARDAA